MKKILTYIAVIAASVGLFFYLFTTQVQATNLFLSTVGTSTMPGGLNMGTGCYAIGGNCLTLSSFSGTLGVTKGGTGATTFGQGWIFSTGGTGALAASTSPTVNYITATSTSATSTFAYGLNVGTSGGCVALNGTCIGGQTRQFGGNGANGALTLTSGTTTISLGNASYYELDYTSVSISGTGNLTFSNPNANGSLVVIRSQGNVTLTCTNQFCISVRGLGAAGGAGGGACNASLTNGTTGSQGNAFYLFATNGGVGGSTSGAGAALPTAIAPAAWAATSTPMKYGGQFWVGGGGGGGSCGANASASSNGGGAGGAGGGSLLMEVGGALNMTATNVINATGIAGGTNTTVSGNTCAHGGGGGGGGFIRVIYNTLTSVAGTMLVSGGAGGVNTCINSGDSAQNGAGGGGGGGGYTAGSAGSASLTNNAVTGGAGANGVSNTELNTNFY